MLWITNLSAARKRSFCSLTGRAKPSQCTLAVGDVLLVFTFELLHKVVHHATIKVLTTKMRVTRRRLHLKDSVLNRQDRHVESAAAEVKDEHVSLRADLLVQTVRDGSGCRLVDDT